MFQSRIYSRIRSKRPWRGECYSRVTIRVTRSEQSSFVHIWSIPFGRRGRCLQARTASFAYNIVFVLPQNLFHVLTITYGRYSTLTLQNTVYLWIRSKHFRRRQCFFLTEISRNFLKLSLFMVQDWVVLTFRMFVPDDSPPQYLRTKYIHGSRINPFDVENVVYGPQSTSKVQNRVYSWIWSKPFGRQFCWL